MNLRLLVLCIAFTNFLSYGTEAMLNPDNAVILVPAPMTQAIHTVHGGVEQQFYVFSHAYLSQHNNAAKIAYINEHYLKHNTFKNESHARYSFNCKHPSSGPDNKIDIGQLSNEDVPLEANLKSEFGYSYFDLNSKQNNTATLLLYFDDKKPYKHAVLHKKSKPDVIWGFGRELLVWEGEIEYLEPYNEQGNQLSRIDRSSYRLTTHWNAVDLQILTFWTILVGAGTYGAYTKGLPWLREYLKERNKRNRKTMVILPGDAQITIKMAGEGKRRKRLSGNNSTPRK